jgi:hypothetical protein
MPFRALPVQRDGMQVQVTPLFNPAQPAAMSALYESGSCFVNSTDVRVFAAELSRQVQSIDSAVSQSQRNIQIQVLHVEEQIGHLSSISKAMGQLCAPSSCFALLNGLNACQRVSVAASL